MAALEVGSVCVKTFGREKGSRCVVVDLIDRNFVLVTGPPQLTGVKRRRVNIKHLQQTGEKISIKRGSSDEEVAAALGKAKPPAAKPAKERRRRAA
ncbi:MAG: 50S ribosomal protein L14e [Candidatus Bathyarchaeia archaeon]